MRDSNGRFIKGEASQGQGISGYRNGFKKGCRTHWKGGRYIDTNGYVLVLAKEHPYRNKMGYVFEHRLIVEQQIGRYLLPTEQVHHLGSKNNNRPNKLMAFASDGAHKRFAKGLSIPSNDILFDGRLGY